MISLQGVLRGREVLWENLDTESQRRKEEGEEVGRREGERGEGGGRLAYLTTLLNMETGPTLGPLTLSTL